MSRLTPQDWIAAGFRALTENGPTALRAEALAREIKTTKGSFYWHFADVPAFKSAMMDLWEAEATDSYIAMLNDVPGPEAKLRALCAMALTEDETYGGVGVEPAIRAWAKSDDLVAQTIGRVDARRLDFLSALFFDMGLSNPDLPKVFYASLIGLQELGRAGHAVKSGLDTQADMIIALAASD